MALLFDKDYQILRECNLEIEEADVSRFLIFKNFPLPEGIYTAKGELAYSVAVLYVIPENYNTSGGDMFWVHPALVRADGKTIPQTGGGDTRVHAGITYSRWSRHWNRKPWKPKVDNIRTIIDRISWAFQYPDAKRS